MAHFAAPVPSLSQLEPRKVCLIKPSALGDVVNAFPALHALRALWPRAEFVWVISSALRGLVDGHPDIDRVVSYERRRVSGSSGGIRAFLKFLAELRAEQFDLTIDLQGLLRSGLMAAATRAGTRVGLADAREGAVLFYTHRIVPPGTREDAQAVDRLLALANAFGADIRQPSFRVALSPVDRAWARERLRAVPRPRLVLNLGARWETKRWPPAHFAELAKRSVQAFGSGLVTVGAPEDRPLVDELASRLRPIPIHDYCGATTIPRLAAICAESDVVVSNDTGPLHLAVATGVRVVGIYTCTSPEANGPHGPLAQSIQSQVPCRGSYHVRCPRRLECMSELTPDRVWPLVRDQLEAAVAGIGSVA